MDMNHLIGQRFNLISKSDIRYVGTLHEINPEASTIALENVMSYGTEGRRGDGTDVPPSTNIYEYIVFRGSDVKDISVAAEEKKDPAPEPPRVPDDPAILGNMSRPGPGPGQEPGAAPGLAQGPPQQPQGAQQTPPGYPQQPPFQGPYPPYGQRFGPPPQFPPGPGFPPYGAPPGWYPPPGHGFPGGPGQFPPNMPMGPPGQQLPPQQRPGPPGMPPNKPTSELPVGEKVPSKPATPAAQHAPTPPVNSKPSVAEATQGSQGPAAMGQKSGRVVPAIPIAAPKPSATINSPHTRAAQGATSVTDATAAATAAVAAAMAKLPQPGASNKSGQADASVDGITRNMNNMRPYDAPRAPRGGGHQHQHHPRGARGGARHQHKKIEVPESDYDFETANAKFNKQDLVKEAIATGSPAAEAESQASAEVEAASESGATPYNRTASFFDNISSEARDREDTTVQRPGGREWRGEEEKRNIETFGQGSVDGYRGRGRGRGRGFGRGRGGGGGGYGRGRGFGGRGNGMPYRGGRSASQSTGVPSLS